MTSAEVENTSTVAPGGPGSVSGGDSGARPSASRRLGLTALFLGAYAVGTDGFMIAGLLPRIAADFGTSTAVAAQLVTVFSVGYALGAPVLASVFRRVDRRRLLVAGLIGLAVTNGLAAVGSDLWLLFAVRIGAALAAGVYSPTAAVVAADLSSAKRRGRALSVITGGLTLSIVTGVPLGALVGDHLGWRATFTGVAVLSALLAAILYAALPPIPAKAGAATVRERIAALRLPGIPRVLFTTLLGIFGGYLGYTYVAPISAAIGASGGGSLETVLVCYGLGAATGSLLSGAGVDRFGQVRTVRTGALLQVASLLVLAALAVVHPHLGPAPAAVVFALLGVGSWTYNAPQQHRLIELAPEGATTAVSLNSSAIYAGIALSGAVGGVTMSGGAAWTCVTGAVIALAAVLIAGRRTRSA